MGQTLRRYFQGIDLFLRLNIEGFNESLRLFSDAFEYKNQIVLMLFLVWVFGVLNCENTLRVNKTSLNKILSILGRPLFKLLLRHSL